MVYKLHYFNIRGLAEPIRYLFKYGGVEFEDIRIERENWPNMKESMPLKQMPVLDIDGERVYQSVAISRYLGNKFGLAGKDAWENLQIDIVVDTFTDLRTKISAVFQASESQKEELLKKLKEEILPFFLGKLNEFAEKNGGYLAIKRLTWVDIYVTALSGVIGYVDKDGYSKYPGLKKVVENVESIEAIKKWIAERPVTDL